MTTALREDYIIMSTENALVFTVLIYWFMCILDDGMFHMLLNVLVDEFRQSKVCLQQEKKECIVKEWGNRCVNILYCNTMTCMMKSVSTVYV